MNLPLRTCLLLIATSLACGRTGVGVKAHKTSPIHAGDGDISQLDAGSGDDGQDDYQDGPIFDDPPNPGDGDAVYDDLDFGDDVLDEDPDGDSPPPPDDGGDSCTSWLEERQSFIDHHSDCINDSDCSVIGDCSGSADFFAVSNWAAMEAYNLLNQQPYQCGAWDGDTYKAVCIDYRCTTQPDGHYCGEPMGDGGPQIGFEDAGVSVGFP